MSRLLSLGLAALIGLSLVTPRGWAADEFAVDNSHTSVIFGVSHLGYSFTYGRFNKVSGAFTLDPAGPEASTFQLAIDASSIDTNDAKRDEHLRGPDFFDAGQFPAITFKSTKVEGKRTDAGMTLLVTGDLTMHGVTKPVTLELQKLGEGPGPGGGFRTGFNCQAKLKRSDFGMTNMIPSVGDEVAITISFEGVRKDGGPAPAGPAAATGALPTTPATILR
ncbi:MAG TPA: YceI family protein [Lacipirellula sp.]